MKVLLVDNNDSFTYNLVDILRCFADIEVIASNRLNIDDVQSFDKIIFSPGPGLPTDQPAMFDILERFSSTKHILGVCLGMQAICSFYGADLYNLSCLVHGQVRSVDILDSDNIFVALPSKIDVGLYHSWAVSIANLPVILKPMAISEDGVLMSVRHRAHNVFGLQFHPESHITPMGKTILKNFLSL